MAKDWSKAPLDVLYLIAKKMAILTDMVHFSAVCKPWRLLVLHHNWFGLPVEAIGKSSLPRLMLAEADDTEGARRGFFDLTTGRVLKIPLPEARGRRCCGSSHGWLVTLGENLEMHLLNPLSGEQVQLPPQSTFGYTRQQLRKTVIEKAILTRSPGGGGRIYLVAALLSTVGLRPALAYVRPGEDAWTLVTNEHYLPHDDIIFYKEQLYGVRRDGIIVSWDFDPEHEWKPITWDMSDRFGYDFEDGIYWRFYLVEVFGELVLVARALEHLFDHVSDECYSYSTYAVKLIKFQFKKFSGRSTDIMSLGDCCLFLGGSSSKCISPVPQGCRANCIYFTDNHYHCCFFCCHRPRRHDMGVFSLDDGKFEPFCIGISGSDFSPPIWVTMNSSK